MCKSALVRNLLAAAAVGLFVSAASSPGVADVSGCRKCMADKLKDAGAKGKWEAWITLLNATGSPKDRCLQAINSGSRAAVDEWLDSVPECAKVCFEVKQIARGKICPFK